jgi:hypothetical protein
MGKLVGIRLRSRCEVQKESNTAAHPAMNASNRVSTVIWRINRPRPAPSAERTAISRARPVAFTINRLAALAQAITSTKANTTINIPVNAVT